MKTTCRKRHSCDYTKPSVRLIELESVVPILAQSIKADTDGDSETREGVEDFVVDTVDVIGF